MEITVGYFSSLAAFNLLILMWSCLDLGSLCSPSEYLQNLGGCGCARASPQPGQATPASFQSPGPCSEAQDTRGHGPGVQTEVLAGFWEKRNQPKVFAICRRCKYPSGLFCCFSLSSVANWGGWDGFAPLFSFCGSNVNVNVTFLQLLA